MAKDKNGNDLVLRSIVRYRNKRWMITQINGGVVMLQWGDDITVAKASKVTKVFT